MVKSKFTLKRGLLIIVMLTGFLVLLGCAAKADSITLSDTTVTLTVGETKKVVATVLPEDVESVVEWTSDKAAVATVSSSGVIKAVSEGTAKITATVDKQSATVTVTVVLEKFTVTFDSNKGTAVAAVEVEDGKKLALPTNPTREGFDFVGWYKAADLAEAFDVNTAITEDITLYAKWKQQQITVKFETNEGTAIADKTMGYGTKPLSSLFSDRPTKEGYVFDGWFTDAEFTTTVDYDVVVTEGFTVYAKWTARVYKITLQLNGGAGVSELEGTFGIALAKPDDPVKIGQIFRGWFTEEALENEYNFDTLVSGPMTLYAKWEIDPAFKTITFDLNEGKWSLTSHDVILGAMPTKEFALGSYQFGYMANYTTSIFLWKAQSTSANNLYTNRAALKLNADGLFEVTKFYASGTKVTAEELGANDYVLFAHDGFAAGFDFVGGLVAGDIITVTGFDINTVADSLVTATVHVYPAGTKIPATSVIAIDTVLPIPSKENHIFAGWYAAADFSGDPVTKATENGTLYAKWNKSHLVTFDTDGGTEIETQLVPGTAAKQPVAPTKEGFAFAGWFADVDKTIAFDFATLITGDTTIYAKWSVGVLVNFEDADGVVIDPVRILEGTAVAEPATPVKAGFVFDGWFTDADTTLAYDFATLVNEEFTLYAKWLVEYTITYNLDGGTLLYENKTEMITAFLTDFYDYVKPTEDLVTFMHGEGKTTGFAGTWDTVHKAKVYDGPRPVAADDTKAFFIYQPQYYAKWMPFFDNIDAYVKAVNNTQAFFATGTWVGLLRLQDYITGDANRVQDSMMPAEFKFAHTFTVKTETIALNKAAKEGFVFDGWYATADFTDTVVTEVVKGSEANVVLYAKWTPVE